jgi:hypothetical protein|tara:strand:+ start:277 stop:552 length:276 start_codon:yes stop_codon:yes gene_type:complete
VDSLHREVVALDLPVVVLLQVEVAAVEKMVMEVILESIHTLVLTVVETHLIVVSEERVVMDCYLQYMLLQVVLAAAEVVPVDMVHQVQTLP